MPVPKGPITLSSFRSSINDMGEPNEETPPKTRIVIFDDELDDENPTKTRDDIVEKDYELVVDYWIDDMMNEDKKLYETFKTHFAFLGVLLNARGHAGQRGLVLDKLEMEQLDGEIKEARDTIEEIQGKMKDTMDADHIRVLREIKEITKNATNRTLMIDACRWHKLHEIIRCEMKFSPALNTTKLKAHYYFIEYCRPVLGLEVHRLKGAPIESEESDESPPSVVDRYVNLYQMAKFMLANGLLKKEFLDRHRGCSHEEILHHYAGFLYIEEIGLEEKARDATYQEILNHFQ